MRILDDKNRLFGIANPIDVLAVLAALAAVFVVVNILFGNPATSPIAAKDKTVEIVWRVNDLRAFDPANVSKGDVAVRRGGNMGTLGEVVKVETRPAERDIAMDNGGIQLTQSPQFEDVFVTIRGKGDIREKGSFLGAEKVRTNMELEIELPRFEAIGRIASLKLVEE